MSELLNKAFTLLGLLKPLDGKKEWGSGELARLSGYNTATTHRILQDMQKHGFVIQNKDNKKFTLGPSLVELGFQAQSLFTIRDIARPFMDDLANKTGESIYLNIEVNCKEALLIDSIDSNQELRVFEPVGIRLPLHIGATRRVILAYLLPDVQADYIEHCDFVLRTQETVNTKEGLIKDLQIIRERGYAVSYGETTLGTAGIAVPIFGPKGVEGSLGIATPDVRLDDARVYEFAILLKQASKKISSLYGSSYNI